MSVARDRVTVALPPAAAFDLWLDPRRWPTFVDGWGRIDRHDQHWPAPGATVVWKSRPGGRGTVTLKVLELEPPSRVVVRVYDDKLAGTETATFSLDERGAALDVELDYKLSDGGPLMAVANALYVRRALRDSIRRTLRRFVIEAEEDAALQSG